jgi:hypothetical protein
MVGVWMQVILYYNNFIFYNHKSYYFNNWQDWSGAR